MANKRLLWVGDAGCDSGFARCTHETLNVLQSEFEVMVLGINYFGDPHGYPYPIFPAHVGGDLFGIGRVKQLVERHQPDFVILQNDPWNIPPYVEALLSTGKPLVGSIAIDGKNIQGENLNGLDLAIFWTEFARNEAIRGGFTGPSAIIPLGVDTNLFKPMDRKVARDLVGIPASMHDQYFVGNVNRNQLRKRMDLFIEYFAEWIKSQRIRDAWMMMHVAPTGDQGFDCGQLAQYYGVKDRLIFVEPGVRKGVTNKRMVATYNSFDVQFTTTQGEGWGLPTLEGMACGIPQIVPAWSALGEWTKDAAVQVPCPTTAVTPNFLNTVGGVMDKERAVAELHRMYVHKDLREAYSTDGLARAREPRFRWENIGDMFIRAIKRHIYSEQVSLIA